MIVHFASGQMMMRWNHKLISLITKTDYDIIFCIQVCFIHQGQSSVHPTEQMINAGVTPMAMTTGTVVSQTAVSQIEDRE